MPSRNTLKVYVKDAFYHIYNRGVAKQDIFSDDIDYKVFLKYLKDALTEPKVKKVIFILQGQSFKGITKAVKNFKDKIELIAFCLMPNHFHLLIKQNDKNQMENFMRSIVTRYARYFNTKYKRVGHVFQGRYKAVMIKDDEYLLHLTRYIHLNPSENVKDLAKAYSSYADYLGLRKTSWLKPEIVINFFNKQVLSEFKKTTDYKSFVEKNKKDISTLLGDLTLE